MNAANRILVVLVFLLIAAVVFMAAQLVVVQDPPIAVQNRGGADPGDNSELPQPTNRGRRVSAHALSRAQEQLSQLQNALDESQALLMKRTASLRKRDAECVALQQELDDSIAFYFATLEGADSDQPDLVDNLSKQLQGLQAEFRNTSQAWRDQIRELEQLRAALVEAELQTAEMRMAATDEIASLVAEQESLTAAFRNTLMLIEADIVPVLVDLLAEPHPAVRAWAAAGLADLGPEAAAAGPALSQLLRDEDERVRHEARRAITAIGG